VAEAERIVLAHEADFVLGRLRVSPARRELIRDDGARAVIEHRVMQVLVALAKAGGNILTRDELTAQCWEGRVVGEDAINRVMSHLRKTAHGIGAGSFEIETITKVGYRLTGDDHVALLMPNERVVHHQSSRRATLMGAGVTIALIVALLFWRPWNAIAKVPTVLVTAGHLDRASQALADDLAVRLANSPSVQSGALRLVTSTERAADKPALLLQLTSVPAQQTPAVNLLLRSTADASIIWSHDFEQGQRSAADMKLQMASTADRVLACASDAFGRNGNSLTPQAREPYLTACAKTAEGRSFDQRPVVAGLSQVIAAAPRFAPAWRKLLVAEADVIEYSDMAEPTPAERQMLRTHIAAARRLDPDMAEATIAEAALVPVSDLVAKAALIDRAYRADSHNPVVLMRRTELLQSVGRMNIAIITAQEALDVDPTSADALSNYIWALAVAGHTEAAQQQLKRAERLWAGTDTLDDVESGFYFRFGDPRIGLQEASNRTTTATKLLFLHARANPTGENVQRLLSYYRAHWHDLGRPDFLMQAFAQFHREDELYEIMLNWPHKEGLAGLDNTWFRPALHQFRRDPRFMLLAARSPLLRYWRATGQWPDFCFEPDLPYDCKKEAARLPA
jgi:DNA-binding winged helix-turn-helix (wHTH) protein/tetratricopeptide (TPR) repeat protein